MDISWFLCKKHKIIDRNIIDELKWELNFFHTYLKYSTIALIWYLICKNLISRSDTVFNYVTSTNLVDICFNLIGWLVLGSSQWNA